MSEDLQAEENLRQALNRVHRLPWKKQRERILKKAVRAAMMGLGVSHAALVADLDTPPCPEAEKKPS